jgi:hypothetical protein
VSSIDPPIVAEDSILGMTAEFSEAAKILFAEDSVDATLGQVVGLAVATIEGCDLAGVFLVEGGVVTTRARTSPLVVDVDGLQHRTGEGPGLDAVTLGTPYYADDLGEEPRWPRFSSQAVAAGIRSVFAVPLSVDSPVGALNLYAQLPGAFGVVDRARGVLLAALASLAVSSAQSHEDDERRAANLHAALVTREVIGQAQGILMERERITPDQAFDVLRRASQRLNRKLHEIAQSLVDTGEQPPDFGHPPS